ncbi:MAG TPA: DUF3782 domain-containing protein [Geobacterales bacterium]|nr:DUF3782 domain-containing protein [Geobacterales bacterium]
MQRERLRKALIDLLEQDKEFRYTVAGLIGYKEILERLANVEERLLKVEERIADLNERLLKVEERLANVEERLLKVEERLANHEERLLKVEERLANVEERLLKVEERIADLNERLLKVEERLLKVEERLANHEERLLKVEERLANVEERLLKVEERLLKVEEEIKNLRIDMQEGFKRFERLITALGARWGIMSEKALREALKGVFGKEMGYSITAWNTYDESGYVYGYPSNVELDIVISDDKIIALEVSSHIKKSDVYIFRKKVELYGKKVGKNVQRLIFVTPFIDDEAREACQAVGIEVYSP